MLRTDYKNSHFVWSTQDELNTLRQFGRESGRNRLILLKGYLESLSKRVVWEGIVKERVRRYVEEEIKAVESGFVP